MGNFLKVTIAASVACILASGCAKEASTGKNENEKLYFDSWMQIHHPGVEKSGLGIYILPEYEVQGDVTDPEAVADSQYVYVNYTSWNLAGQVTGYTDAETAKMLGEYEPDSRYYGPVIWTRVAGYLYAGVNEMFTGMKEGDSRRAVIPGWLMGYRWYGTEQEFLDNVEGTDSIYDITVIDPINNISKWQVDSIGRFISGGYADHDFGYLTADLLKSYFESNNITSAKDSSDKYGFYFIEIDHGTELEPVESDDEEDSSDEEENGEYDWEDSHFYTTSGSRDTTIYINYVGRLLNGQVFDTNIERVAMDNGLSGGTYSPSAIQWGESYTNIEMGASGSSSSIITGFAMTLWRMHPFGKAIGIFYSDLGYGISGSGEMIPAYSPLMFEIEIVENPNKK